MKLGGDFKGNQWDDAPCYVQTWPRVVLHTSVKAMDGVQNPSYCLNFVNSTGADYPAYVLFKVWSVIRKMAGLKKLQGLQQCRLTILQWLLGPQMSEPHIHIDFRGYWNQTFGLTLTSEATGAGDLITMYSLFLQETWTHCTPCSHRIQKSGASHTKLEISKSSQIFISRHKKPGNYGKKYSKLWKKVWPKNTLLYCLS